MPGRVQDDHSTAGDATGNEIADLLGGDDVFAAFEDEVGTETSARSLRLSEVKVTRANALAISGSVRQKLFVSS